MADNTDLLKQIREVVREEVEAEAKTTRRENAWKSLEVSQKIDTLTDRVKNVELSNTRLEKVQQEIKTTQKAHGEKLDEHGKQLTDIKRVQKEHGGKIDTLLNEAAHTRSAFKALDDIVKETKSELNEVKRRQIPRKAD